MLSSKNSRHRPDALDAAPRRVDVDAVVGEELRERVPRQLARVDAAAHVAVAVDDRFDLVACVCSQPVPLSGQNSFRSWRVVLAQVVERDLDAVDAAARRRRRAPGA